MPTVVAPKINPITEAVFQSLSRQYEEHLIREHLHYGEVEAAALHEAIRVAAAHPGEERRVWETMEASISEANIELLELDAPRLRWVGYPTFRSMLDAEAYPSVSAA